MKNTTHHVFDRVEPPAVRARLIGRAGHRPEGTGLETGGYVTGQELFGDNPWLGLAAVAGVLVLGWVIINLFLRL